MKRNVQGIDTSGAVRSGRSTRRTLLKGATWAVPAAAVVTAAPAFAASAACRESDLQLNWGMANYSGSPQLTAPFATEVGFDPQVQGEMFPGLDSPLSVQIQHSWSGNARGAGGNNNGRISTFNVGGIGQVGYGLYQQIGSTGRTRPTDNDYQTIRFAFSEELTNLSFSITDIDRMWQTSGLGATRDFIDGVSLSSPTPFTSQAPSSSEVIGSGTVASPWRIERNVNHSENGPGGQIDILFTEPVTEFTIRYDNLARGADPNTNNDQAVFVTGFTTNRPAACGG